MTGTFHRGVIEQLEVSGGPGDYKFEVQALMDKASRHVQPDLLYADAGYDAEWVHRYCHEDWGVMLVLKLVSHP